MVTGAVPHPTPFTVTLAPGGWVNTRSSVSLDIRGSLSAAISASVAIVGTETVPGGRPGTSCSRPPAATGCTFSELDGLKTGLDPGAPLPTTDPAPFPARS